MDAEGLEVFEDVKHGILHKVSVPVLSERINPHACKLEDLGTA